MTVYTLVGCSLHERDQVRQKGMAYVSYMQEVPQLIPLIALGKAFHSHIRSD